MKIAKLKITTHFHFQKREREEKKFACKTKANISLTLFNPYNL